MLKRSPSRNAESLFALPQMAIQYFSVLWISKCIFFSRASFCKYVQAQTSLKMILEEKSSVFISCHSGCWHLHEHPIHMWYVMNCVFLLLTTSSGEGFDAPVCLKGERERAVCRPRQIFNSTLWEPSEHLVTRIIVHRQPPPNCPHEAERTLNI